MRTRHNPAPDSNLIAWLRLPAADSSTHRLEAGATFQNTPTITASVTTDVSTLSTMVPEASAPSPFISNAMV